MHLPASSLAIEEMVIHPVLLQNGYFKQFFKNGFF